jgi:hypothetical protein
LYVQITINKNFNFKKVYYMKKYILGGIACIIIAVAAVLNVSISAKSLSKRLSYISLANIEALATSEGGNANDCPGGYCSYSDATSSCSACCPTGKDPSCGSFGCTCK